MTRSLAPRTSNVTRSPVPVGVLTYGLDRPLSGIGRYTVELLRALRGYDVEAAITLINPFAGRIASLGDEQDHYPATRIYGRLLPTLMTVGPPQIAAVARRRGLAVVHDPFGVSPFWVPRGVGDFARVVTIHDVVPFVYPETHARLTNLLFRRYIPRTLRFVDQIVTDSVCSRQDIIRYFGVDARNVTVIPCGVNAAFMPVARGETAGVLARYGIPEEYVLTVGSLQARKNLETLFEAYAVLRERGLRHRLVVVGKKEWKAAGIFRRLRELGLAEDVILTGYVPDADLPALYSGASAFVFPSLYEGFGLPPLEAMACGTPVVTSNSSSLPEVVGDAGIEVDPCDVRGFVEAIGRLLSDGDLAGTYRERGLARARGFTWERAAAAHVGLYRELGGGGVGGSLDSSG